MCVCVCVISLFPDGKEANVDVMGSSASALRTAVRAFAGRTDVIPIQDEFWEQFWPSTHLIPLQTVFDEVRAEDVRSVRSNCAKNLATLLRRGVLKLAAATETGLATSAAKIATTNCVRVLMRIIPYVLEEPTWHGLFWTPTPVGVIVPMPEGHTAPPLRRGASPEALEREAKALAALEREILQKQGVDPTASREPLPLAITLVNAILDLLFAPGYTVAKMAAVGAPYEKGKPEGSRKVRTHDGVHFIWSTGLGHSKAYPVMPTHDERRGDLLRLLLATLAQPLYEQAATLDLQQQSLLNHVVSGAHRNAIPLVWSLINLLCGYDPVGWGVPYGQVWVPDYQRDALLSLSGQLLGLMLDHAPPSFTVMEQVDVAATPEAAATSVPAVAAADGTTTTTTSSVAREVPGVNVMRRFIERIDDEAHFEFLVTGIVRLMTNPYELTWMPASQKRVELSRELVSLLWRLCDSNSKFLAYLLRSTSCLQVLVPLLRAMNDARADVSQVGLVQTGIYVLLKLSGERNFAVLLNQACAQDYPMDVPSFSGTHADLLVLVLYNLMVDTNFRLTSLYECILTTVANVSPYLKTLTLVAANKLVRLFEVFSSAKFVLANETNHHLVFYLLEAFNNLIQYQFEGNTPLIYVLIRRRRIFYAFEQLSISTFDDSVASAAAAAAAADPPIGGDANSRLFETASLFVPAQASGKKTPNSKGAGLIQSRLELESAAPEHFTVQAAESRDRMEVERGIVPVVNKNSGGDDGFAPTDEWLREWFARLPLATIQRTLEVLVPQVEQLCREKSVTDEAEIMEFLQRGTLVGLLPVPHPILIRRASPHKGSSLWYTSFQWSTIYLKNLNPDLFHGTHVRLFVVSSSE